MMRLTKAVADRKAGKKEVSTMGKKKRSFMKQVMIPAFCGAVTAVNLMSTTAFAAGTEAVTKPLDSLKTLIIAVIGAIGVIILAKNVMEFAQAYQQQDSSTMNSACRRYDGRYFIRAYLPWFLRRSLWTENTTLSMLILPGISGFILKKVEVEVQMFIIRPCLLKI